MKPWMHVVDRWFTKHFMAPPEPVLVEFSVNELKTLLQGLQVCSAIRDAQLSGQGYEGWFHNELNVPFLQSQKSVMDSMIKKLQVHLRGQF